MRIVGDISEVNDDARVQKALRRLAAEKAPTSLSQLVMWNLAAGLDWNTIAQLSRGWSNRHELTLAKEFVDRLDTLPVGESGRLFVEVVGSDEASQAQRSRVEQGAARQVHSGIGRPGVGQAFGASGGTGDCVAA